jgi:hypothetical protein
MRFCNLIVFTFVLLCMFLCCILSKQLTGFHDMNALIFGPICLYCINLITF